MGGALLTPESLTGGDRKVVSSVISLARPKEHLTNLHQIGSAMIYEAETLEAVRSVIEADIYYTSGVVSCPVLSSICKK
jgi:hypothetical protein